MKILIEGNETLTKQCILANSSAACWSSKKSLKRALKELTNQPLLLKFLSTWSWIGVFSCTYAELSAKILFLNWPLPWSTNKLYLIYIRLSYKTFKPKSLSKIGYVVKATTNKKLLGRCGRNNATCLPFETFGTIRWHRIEWCHLRIIHSCYCMH